MRPNIRPIDREKQLDTGDFIVSKTDPKGIITYVNRVFLDISGYDEGELLGQPHNMIRHPDMPKAAFRDLWTTIKAGKEWRGIVKNLCKDGSYYWVDAYVVPTLENGVIIGYTSMRRRPTDAQVRAVLPLYRQWLAEETR